MLGFHIIDIIVIIVYFSVMIYIGYRAMSKIKNQEDFFMGGRSFGKFLQTFSMFGQATSAESAVTASSVVGQKGLAGLFFFVFGLFTLPIFWFTSLWSRRLRIMTMGDFFVERFKCKKLAVLYSLAQATMFIMVGGMGLYAMSKTVAAISLKPKAAYTQVENVEYAKAMELKELESKPVELLSAEQGTRLKSLRRQGPRGRFSYVNTNMLIVCMAIFILLYAIGGGLEAAVWTDAIQSVFILILTAMLIPFAMVQINADFGSSGVLGAFQTVHQTLPAAMLELFGSPKLAEFTWYYMLLLTLVGTAGGFAYANNLVVCGAAKSEDAARWGAMNGIVLKRFCTIIWAILALFILVLYGSQTSDADMLWGIATKNLLPVGLTGLMVACLMAALMSTADTHMLVVSGLLTQNIYKLIVGNDKSEGHYLKVGRVFGVLFITCAVLVAMNSDNLFEMFKFMLMINVTMGPCILMAYLWRRTNVAGAWCSMGISMALSVILPFLISMIPAARDSVALHAEVKPVPIEKRYVAKAKDVEARQGQITTWNLLNAEGKSKGECPVVLKSGETFEQSYAPPAMAIFWASGIKEDDDGKAYGAGLFNADLYLLSLCGMDLTKNSIAVNKSVSLAFKLIFPFVALILFGLFAKPVDSMTLDRFYGKLLTPVNPDHDEDAKEVERTFHDPTRQNHRKLFPESNWYIRRWDWQDWKGIIYGVVAMVVLYGVTFILVTLGS